MVEGGINVMQQHAQETSNVHVAIISAPTLSNDWISNSQ
jgi:hypothetical protein